MSDQFTKRLNKILPKITSDEFLGGKGIGNEIAFHIFDYPPEQELKIRQHIDFLLDHIQRIKPDLQVKHINVFDFILEYLEERGYLQKALLMQREKGNANLLEALKGLLNEKNIAARLGSIVQPEQSGLILISGIGSAYPMLRSHTLLNNLHSIMGLTPLVMFYPGKYDQTSLRLFGKSGTVGGANSNQTKSVNYYRAFRLID